MRTLWWMVDVLLRDTVRSKARRRGGVVNINEMTKNSKGEMVVLFCGR